MLELELAGIPSTGATRPRRDGSVHLPLSRTAFIASIAAHVLAGYALTRHQWADAPPAAETIAAFFVFELPVSRPERAPEAEPVPAVPEPPPQAEERQLEPPPRVAETVPESAPQVAPEPIVVSEPPPVTEAAPVDEGVVPPAPFIDFDEVRQRAAREVVIEGAAESEYLTFSLDDVAPPRREAVPEPKRSIFDGTGEPRGPKVGQLGQQRTKLGHRVAGLCNALTGGFSLMGFGSFCAPPPDGGHSGLFPEVRPEYLDLLPECVDTRDTAPALALEAPFSTVKCRLVKREDLVDQP